MYRVTVNLVVNMFATSEIMMKHKILANQTGRLLGKNL